MSCQKQVSGDTVDSLPESPASDSRINATAFALKYGIKSPAIFRGGYLFSIRLYTLEGNLYVGGVFDGTAVPWSPTTPGSFYVDTDKMDVWVEKKKKNGASAVKKENMILEDKTFLLHAASSFSRFFQKGIPAGPTLSAKLSAAGFLIDGALKINLELHVRS